MRFGEPICHLFVLLHKSVGLHPIRNMSRSVVRGIMVRGIRKRIQQNDDRRKGSKTYDGAKSADRVSRSHQLKRIPGLAREGIGFMFVDAMSMRLKPSRGRLERYGRTFLAVAQCSGSNRMVDASTITGGLCGRGERLRLCGLGKAFLSAQRGDHFLGFSGGVIWKRFSLVGASQRRIEVSQELAPPEIRLNRHPTLQPNLQRDLASCFLMR